MVSTIFETTKTQEIAWFFYWGNFVFLILYLASILFIFLHSYYKDKKANLFRVISLIAILLIIPSIVFSFLTIELKTKLSSFIVLFFILGVIGGVIEIVIAFLYFIYNKNEKKENYCQIHNIFYKESLCPICSIDFESNTNKQSSNTIVEKSLESKGFLINTSNSRVFNLFKSNLIGRTKVSGDFNNIIIENDPYVSRIHAKIVFDGLRFKLSDSSSTSGTFLNGNKITGWVTLEDGDLIKVGKTVLKFTQK